MLGVIVNRIRFQVTKMVMLACLTAALTSCATKEPPLIADPSAAANETALPWNRQEKWEQEGPASAMNQQRR